MTDQPQTRKGTGWNVDEEVQLATEFDAGVSLQDMVIAHQRTPAAIVSRLVHLGYLANHPRARGYITTRLWCTYSQAKGG